MKNGIVARVVASVAISLVLSGCSSNNNSVDSNGEVETQPAEILEFGETVTAKQDENELEIKLKSIELQHEIKDRHLKDVDGETYLCVTLNIKNLGAERVTSSLIENGNLSVKFGDNFTYDEIMCINVDNYGLTRNWYLDQWCALDVMLYKSIPDDVVMSPFVLKFKIGDKNYEISHEKLEEPIRPAIKQKIDEAYSAQIQADKAYSDWKAKYGDGKNVPESYKAKADAEAHAALDSLEKAIKLSEEMIKMAENGEFNLAELKYYNEKKVS